MPASARKQRETAERRERVLSKRSTGMTYQQIADTEPTLSTASAAVQDHSRALASRARQRTAVADFDLIAELERLDGLERAAQTIMRTAAATGPGHNPKLALQAIDRLERISNRRAKLLNLGAGQQQREPGGPTSGVVNEIAAKRAQRRRAAGW
jgi:hypothetical protein